MYQSVIDFWFEEISPEKWWQKDAEFDLLIKERFLKFHQQAKQCELYPWRNSALGRLAEIIILDQFSRNIYRDTPAAFATDALALALAQEAVATAADQEVDPEHRSFFYLPFMHSESQKIHEFAVALYESLGNKDKLEFELRHKAIIDQFGRYPHRNTILGRSSTEEELVFLSQAGSSF